jgi:glyoxylase-like metal-dependent hydrolase (beta-lactamase superfamily II)
LYRVNKQDTNLEIEPNDLKNKMDSNQDVFFLDVRTPEEYETWRISYNNYLYPPLIPIDRFFKSVPDSILKQIPRNKEIITVCSHGNRSMIVARILSKMGYNAKSIKGGMSSWNKVYDVASIHLGASSSLKIWQIRRVSKGCIGYIISTQNEKNAVIVDPTCDIAETYMKVIKDNGLRITKILDTHMHADHVSGVTALLKATENMSDAYFSSLEGYEVDDNNKNNHQSNIKHVKDGDNIHVSETVWLKAIHTPGHTNGSMCFKIIYDTNKNDYANEYLLTGDTLFIDGVGRPDLRDKATEFTASLYDTYHQKILNLPDNTVILPSHFNVTSINLKHRKVIFNTLGSIKENVQLLSLDKKQFIKSVMKVIPPKPANYQTILRINKKMTPCDRVEIGELEVGPNSCAT